MKWQIWILLLAAALLFGCAAKPVEPDPAETEPVPDTQDTEPAGTTLTFDSFDGGGPSYTLLVDDPSLVSVQREVEYGRPDHAELDGAAYSVIYRFQGLKPGQTALTVQQRSPITENLDWRYAVTVDDELNVRLDVLDVVNLDEVPDAIRPVPTMVIAIGDEVFYAAPEDNPSADALVEELSSMPLILEMHDDAEFEKVGALPWTLPTDDTTITTVPGDILLFNGDQLAICCGENTGSLTRVAKIDAVTEEELLSALGSGDVTVTIWVEWSE